MEVEERLAALEDRVAALEGRKSVDPAKFWALTGLRERLPDSGGVLFTGAVSLPTGEYYEWQQEAMAEDQFDRDWSDLSGVLAALGHPVRLLLLKEILKGARSTAELQEHESLGTTGQLYHHLRQLVAAGWLRAAGRGQYAVPGSRVVPLLVVLAAIQEPA
ncbi:ArsR/SmtB family transcription factor [Actinocrispum wychmicini]|uniref:Helix-turn-helix protein n=1 Tax=Actinocrispum wychmicini TaxID=1213861 RepID=A0A4R2K6H7_9PSEU|nr:winged helix-turn-helix domain-containing protein [Actinocrispum wychmicini]TCO65526.1 helix-turn-helix protein [Actinocrispum wychmicini]